jgi:hypothetical protein
VDILKRNPAGKDTAPVSFKISSDTTFQVTGEPPPPIMHDAGCCVCEREFKLSDWGSTEITFTISPQLANVSWVNPEGHDTPGHISIKYCPQKTHKFELNADLGGADVGPLYSSEKGPIEDSAPQANYRAKVATD